jgi:hypothetical protein
MAGVAKGGQGKGVALGQAPPVDRAGACGSAILRFGRSTGGRRMLEMRAHKAYRKAWLALPRTARAEVFELANDPRPHPDDAVVPVATAMARDGWQGRVAKAVFAYNLGGAAGLWLVTYSGLPLMLGLLAVWTGIVLAARRTHYATQRWNKVYSANAVRMGRANLGGFVLRPLSIVGRPRFTPRRIGRALLLNCWLINLPLWLVVVAASGDSLATILSVALIVLFILGGFARAHFAARRRLPQWQRLRPPPGIQVARLDEVGLWLPERTVPWADVRSIDMELNPSAVYFDADQLIRLPPMWSIEPPAEEIIFAATEFKRLAAESPAHARSLSLPPDATTAHPLAAM